MGQGQGRREGGEEGGRQSRSARTREVGHQRGVGVALSKRLHRALQVQPTHGRLQLVHLHSRRVPAAAAMQPRTVQCAACLWPMHAVGSLQDAPPSMPSTTLLPLPPTCSPYRRPRILRSRKTVNPSFSQKLCQLALVTRLPVPGGGQRRGGCAPSQGPAPAQQLGAWEHGSSTPPARQAGGRGRQLHGRPHPSRSARSRALPRWPASGRRPGWWDGGTGEDAVAGAGGTGSRPACTCRPHAHRRLRPSAADG